MSTVAILRSWGGRASVACAERLSASSAIARIVVVLDVARDREGTGISLRNVPRVEVVELADGGWAASLNAGIARASDAPVVLAISPGVTLREREIASLVAHAREPGTSAAFVTFRDRCEPPFLLPRNTCAAWPGELLARHPFDESLDAHGGQEDWELVLRAYDVEGHLPVLAARDVELAPRPEGELAAKLAREERALRYVEARHRDDVVTAVRQHVARALASR